MISEGERESLLDALKRVPDPRSRKGRSYPLWGLLAMLVLGALHGERSLRGMWMWGVKHWAQLYTLLGLLGNPHAPVYSTVWEVMSRLDVQTMEELMMRWIASWAPVGKVSVDGKEIRGSKRHGGEQEAIKVVTAAGQDLQVVLGQVGVGDGSELKAAVELLRALPLQGKVVTVDAGLLHRDLVETVLNQGGDYLGLIKDNEPEVKQMVDEWIEPQIFPPGTGTPGR